MSDKIRQCAEECAEEICLNGVGIGLTDRIERAMRKLLAGRVARGIELALEEHSAKLCPEDFNCETYIAELQRQIPNLKAQQAERVKEAERQAQAAEAKVWQNATEMIAYGNDIRTWAKKRIAELEAKR